MKLTAAALAASSFALAGASCQQVPPAPPVAVEVRVPVPVPCQVAEPVCMAPAYDAARKDQPGDTKVKLLRAEAIGYEDCVAAYRRALAACRAAVAPQ